MRIKFESNFKTSKKNKSVSLSSQKVAKSDYAQLLKADVETPF